MNTETFRVYKAAERTPQLLQKIVALWEESVRATHAFLSEKEIAEIKEYVPSAVCAVEHLAAAEDAFGNLLGFLGAEDGRLEMLLLLPKARGRGLGKRLLLFGISEFEITELTVNEQNPQAAGFYEHMGFKVYKRAALDEQGNPYPLLYMRRS